MALLTKFQFNIEKPLVQAAIIIVSVFVVNIGSLMVIATGLIEVTNRFPWLNAASFMLFFCRSKQYILNYSKKCSSLLGAFYVQFHDCGRCFWLTGLGFLWYSHYRCGFLYVDLRSCNLWIPRFPYHYGYP